MDRYLNLRWWCFTLIFRFRWKGSLFFWSCVWSNQRRKAFLLLISSIFRERFFLFFWVLLLHGGDRGNLSSYIKIISAWVPFWRARVLGVLLLGLVWLRFDLETCWICVCRAIDYFLSRVDLDFLVGSCWLTRNSGTFWVFSIFLSIFFVFFGSWGCFSWVAATRTTLRNWVRWGKIELLIGGLLFLNWWKMFLFAGERRWRFCCVWWWLFRF